MLSKKLYDSFGSVTKSEGFEMLAQGIMRSFKSDEDFAYWVFSGGANLFSYINVLNDKDALEDLTGMIVEIMKPSLSNKELDIIRKDKSSYKFIVSWLKELGQAAEENSKIKHLSSAKRNMYCAFLCILLNYTSIDDEAIAPELTDEEIASQEFEMINPEDLEVNTAPLVEASENPTTEDTKLIEA